MTVLLRRQVQLKTHFQLLPCSNSGTYGQGLKWGRSLVSFTPPPLPAEWWAWGSGFVVKAEVEAGQMSTSVLHDGLLLANVAYWPLCDRHPNTGVRVWKFFRDMRDLPRKALLITPQMLPWHCPHTLLHMVLASQLKFSYFLWGLLDPWKTHTLLPCHEVSTSYSTASFLSVPSLHFNYLFPYTSTGVMTKK